MVSFGFSHLFICFFLATVYSAPTLSESNQELKDRADALKLVYEENSSFSVEPGPLVSSIPKLLSQIKDLERDAVVPYIAYSRAIQAKLGANASLVLEYKLATGRLLSATMRLSVLQMHMKPIERQRFDRMGQLVRLLLGGKVKDDGTSSSALFDDPLLFYCPWKDIFEELEQPATSLKQFKAVLNQAIVGKYVDGAKIAGYIVSNWRTMLEDIKEVSKDAEKGNRVFSLIQKLTAIKAKYAAIDAKGPVISKPYHSYIGLETYFDAIQLFRKVVLIDKELDLRTLGASISQGQYDHLSSDLDQYSQGMLSLDMMDLSQKMVLLHLRLGFDFPIDIVSRFISEFQINSTQVTYLVSWASYAKISQRYLLEDALSFEAVHYLEIFVDWSRKYNIAMFLDNIMSTTIYEPYPALPQIEDPQWINATAAAYLEVATGLEQSVDDFLLRNNESITSFFQIAKIPRDLVRDITLFYAQETCLRLKDSVELVLGTLDNRKYGEIKGKFRKAKTWWIDIYILVTGEIFVANPTKEEDERLLAARERIVELFQNVFVYLSERQVDSSLSTQLLHFIKKHQKQKPSSSFVKDLRNVFRLAKSSEVFKNVRYLQPKTILAYPAVEAVNRYWDIVNQKERELRMLVGVTNISRREGEKMQKLVTDTTLMYIDVTFRFYKSTLVSLRQNGGASSFGSLEGVAVAWKHFLDLPPEKSLISVAIRYLEKPTEQNLARFFMLFRAYVDELKVRIVCLNFVIPPSDGKQAVTEWLGALEHLFGQGSSTDMADLERRLQTVLSIYSRASIAMDQFIVTNLE